MKPESSPEPPVEQDDRFPSGPWTGFFLQPMLTAGIRHWMELTLTFRNGVLRGEGRDRVGAFLIVGRYDLTDGTCRWSKRYIGKHDVNYRGYNEGKGIWGVWNLDDPPWQGGFHIWPVGMTDPTGSRLSEAKELPVLIDAEMALETDAHVLAGASD